MLLSVWDLRGWELEVLADFLDLIYSIKIRWDAKD